MYEKLLVAVDGSELSEATLPYAEEFAARLGSEVVLLRVCESEEECASSVTQSYMSRLVQSMEAGTRERRSIAGGPAGNQIRVCPVIVRGNPATEIVDYAADNRVGLIVVAARGRSGSPRWPVGAVAEKVLRATRIPLLLIAGVRSRTTVPSRSVLSKALLPLDGSKTGEAALPYVEELGLRLGTEVVVLQVAEHKYIAYGPEVGGYMTYPQEWLAAAEESARFYVMSVEQSLKSKGILAGSMIESGSVADRITEAAQRIGADFIAMSTHGRSGIGKWVFGSIADRVLHSGTMPVLLVRA